MKKGKVILLSLVTFFFLLGLVPLASGCPKPALPEKFVTMLDITDLTGPAAIVCSANTDSMHDGTKYINEVEGGVDGVKIRVVSVDCRYDVARGVSAYKKYRFEPNLVFVGIAITGTTLALLPYIERDKQCAFTPGAGEFAGRPGRVLIAFSTYQDAFAAYMDWAVKDWEAKGKPGKPVFGYMSIDVPAGRDGLHGSLEYAEQKGLKVLKPEFFPVGTLDFLPYLLRLKEANYIFLGDWFDPGPVYVIRDAYKLGLTKDIQFCGDVWTFTKPVLEAYKKELEGVMIISPYLRGEEADRSYAGEVWTQAGRGPLEKMSELYLVGVIGMLRFKEVLRMALKEVGYENISGDAIFQAALKMSGFDPKGLAGPTTWSEKERRGSRTVKFYQIRDGKPVPITGWLVTPDAVALYKW